MVNSTFCIFAFEAPHVPCVCVCMWVRAGVFKCAGTCVCGVCVCVNRVCTCYYMFLLPAAARWSN